MTTSKTKKSVQLSIGGIALVAVITLLVSMFAVERIDSGQTGIIVNLAGSERGVDDAKVETGWVFYNRFTKQLFEYPAFAQIVDYEPFDIKIRKVQFLKLTRPLNITSNVKMPRSFSSVIVKLLSNWNNLSS